MITDQELLLLEKLIHAEETYQRIESLTKHNEDTSVNYIALYDAINSQKWGVDENGKVALLDGYAGYVLEGSSRSSKTWGSCFIIIYLALVKHPEGCTINIYRETYNEFKTTLYDDFKRILTMFDLPNKFLDTDEVKSFKIGKTKITFLGDGKHGGGCDYAFFNEAMMIKQSVFDQVKMRCRVFWWMDYNPSFTEHWVFNSVTPRADVGFLRTTFKDNKFITPTALNEILGYEPWEPGTYEVIDNVIMYEGLPVTEIHQPPPHIDNIDQGTADEFMWKVYGLGLRGSMKGQIFKLVTWIDEFPDIAHTYGLDFGWISDPTALGKYAREGMNIYLDLMIYQPIDNPETLSQALEALGVSKYVPITADSSDKYTSETKGSVQMVNDLYERGWEVSKVSKTQSVMYWLQDMKRYKIHIVKGSGKNSMYKHFKQEQENYVFKEVNGIQINQPSDKFNHAWDACFVGETMITTINGDIPIKDIKKGDLVLTRKGYKRVLDRFDNGIKETTQYKMCVGINSVYLECTNNHKIYTESGWKQIKNLKKGANLNTLSNGLMGNHINYTRMKFTFQEGINECMLRFGNFITGKFQKACTFITKTITNRITIYPTWSVSTERNITQTTAGNELLTTQNGLKNSAEKEGKQQKYGMQAKKGGNGIQNTRKNSGVKEVLQKKNAKYVGVNMKQKPQALQNTVVTTATLLHIEEGRKQKNRVYDLHVEDQHEYFANGILVHNCRYAHMSHDLDNFSVDSN